MGHKVSVYCSLLQFVAASCSKLQCIAMCDESSTPFMNGPQGLLPIANAVYYSLLQCVAVSCRVLQCVNSRPLHL